MMDKEKIRNIIELFIAWNGETEPIDIANLNSAVEFISSSLQEKPVNYNKLNTMLNDALSKETKESWNERLCEEPVSEELDTAIGEYCTSPDNFISYIDTGFAYRSEQKDDIPLIIKAIKFGANWQKAQMMAKAVDGEILEMEDNDCAICSHTHLELFVEPSALERMALEDNDKVKVIVIKEG